MPNMNGEKFPYPQSGVQPAATDKLHSPTLMISGGANDIYSPEVPDVASTSIYLATVAPVGGGANDPYPLPTHESGADGADGGGAA